MRMRRLRVVSCLALVALLALVAFAGCGSDESSSSDDSGSSSARTVSIDVGTGTPIEVDTDKPKIGMLWTSGNLFLQAFEKGAKEEAERRGVDLTVLDSKFDAVRQMQQAQNVLQQKKFDALIVVPLDGNALCPVMTRQAPEQGIPVVSAVVAMCNRGTKPEGDEIWSPGTIAHSGQQITLDAGRSFYKAVNERVGSDGRRHVAALVMGPPLIVGTIASEKSLEQVEEAGEIPNLDVKYRVNTDYTTPDGLARVQTLLQAHPEIDTIMSTYSDITVGAIKAVQAAGLSDKVKVYDQGASGQSLAAIKAGDLELTTATNPFSFGVSAVKAVVDAFEGKRVERWHGGYGPGSRFGNPLVIDRSNVDDYRPEY